MHWIWIILIIVLFIMAIVLSLSYAFFRYMCVPHREIASSLNGKEGRALQPYVPVIKAKALQNAACKHELVETESFDHLKLRAKLYPNRKTDRVLILVHGYQSSSPWDFGASFEMYYRAGYTILALDNRAHGASEGKYIGYGALDQRDVYAWMNWTVARYGKQCRIAIIGVSMGAATVMLTTGNYPIPQLACAYTAIAELTDLLIRQRKVPAHPLRQLASFWCKVFARYFFREVDPEKAVRKSNTPTLFIHGTEDHFVPYWMLDRVYNACAAPKQKASFEGAVHGESSYKYPERYEKLVTEFLGKYMS